MLQLTLPGQARGEVIPIRSYPFRIGRSPSDHLRLQAPGVWEGHCTLEWRAADGIHLVGSSRATTALNGQTVKEARVHNGDSIEIGGVRLLVTVGPANQRSFRILDILVWVALAGVGLVQLFLMLHGLP